MRVSGMPAGEFFNAATKFTDSSYGSINASLTFVASGNKQGYIQYTKTLNSQEFNRYSVNIGARFQF
jgi:hypothetical protein